MALGEVDSAVLHGLRKEDSEGLRTMATWSMYLTVYKFLLVY